MYKRQGLLSAAPFIAVFAGMVVANSLVLDGTAASLHALVGVRGSDERWGRALAYLLLVVPVGVLVWGAEVAVHLSLIHISMCIRDSSPPTR